MKKRNFVVCEACLEENEQLQQQEDDFLERNSKAVAMELFSGT